MSADRQNFRSVCVVGAGPSGLAAVKNLRAHGLAVECLEREDDVGGNWYYGRESSSIGLGTHLISSKRMTEYCDYRMPREFPPYPSHTQALAYLRAYAREFALYDSIRLGVTVTSVEPFAEGGWLVRTADGEEKRYGAVVVANGHHWDPLRPDLPGKFSGELLHTRDIKTPDVYRGRRVLVIGAGNSGCDAAVEACDQAELTLLSMRRGYHFLPKFMLGKPIDRLGDRLRSWGWPLWLRRFASGWMVYLAHGTPGQYGLPTPTHRLFESHPIVNSQLLYHVGHGRIGVRAAVESVAGNRVCFVDGREEQIDLIVQATGYKVTIPFLRPELLATRDGCPDLYLHIFSRQRDDLFVAGLIQPNSGQWGLTDLQTQLIARFLVAKERDPARAATFWRQVTGPSPDMSGGVRFLESPRHRLEIDYYQYRKLLQRQIRKFPPAPQPT